MKDEKTKIRQDQLIEMTSSFCDEKLDDDYKQLCIKLIEKMGTVYDSEMYEDKIS